MDEPKKVNNIQQGSDPNSTKEEVYDELRELLLGTEQVQIEDLQTRLDDPQIHASDVSKILPEAIVASEKQDNRLATALMPTVEQIVRDSVQKDSKTLADALFPVIGTAIKKSIAETLKEMLQSFNETLEQSASLKAIKWRLEAKRTGKTFAEVVLLHKLVYRVEQVFLIHRESGLLLQHVSSQHEALQDADLVSGMLTAIQDFVHDSFSMEKGQLLNTIEVGSFTIWIEQGPDAVLAAAIRGNAPEELRMIFKEELENIHLEKGSELESFDGDTDQFSDIRYRLENCMQSKEKQEKKKNSPFLYIFLIVLIAGIGGWSFVKINSLNHWNDLFEKLQAEPGIVITGVDERKGKRYVTGLRDPLAREPGEVVMQSEIEPSDVVFSMQPFQSLQPDFILKRAIEILKPNEKVTIRLDNTTLRVKGTASNKWITQSRNLARNIAGKRFRINIYKISA